MKHIYTSPFNGWDESAVRIYVYEFESENEYWDLYSMPFEEKCAYFHVFEEPDDAVAPGAMYHRYNFHFTGSHIIMEETVALNV